MDLAKRIGMTQAVAEDAIKRKKSVSEANDYRVPHFTLKLNKNKATINILKYRNCTCKDKEYFDFTSA